VHEISIHAYTPIHRGSDKNIALAQDRSRGNTMRMILHVVTCKCSQTSYNRSCFENR
jgi:hypothetical protein